MSDNVINDILKTFDVNQEITLEFKKIYGFTFVFKKRIITFHDQISAEIKPLGIIYDENGEYYFVPLYRSVNVNEIAYEFVKNYLL